MSAAVALYPKAKHAPRDIASSTCPVGQLADEAAALVAAWQRLNAEIRNADLKEWVAFGPIIGEPEAPEDQEELSAHAVRSELRDRITAVVQLAAHRQATSAKGAAFQALTMNAELIAMYDVGIDARADSERRAELEKAFRHAERALGSIVGFLDHAAGGLPEHLVEYFLLSARGRPGLAADRAVRHFARE